MADPIVHITAGIPDSGTGNITTLGQTLVDGANVTYGATTDVAATAGAAGTISAKLRAISRDIVGGIVLQTGGNVIGAVTQSGGPWSVSGSLTCTQSGVWNITNITGTVSLPTGAATSALQPTNAAQASTTSGQTGTLAMGATTTAAPTYSNGQSNPLSLTTAGALRVDGSGATQPVSGTFWQATQPVSIAAAVTVQQSTAANLKVDLSGTGANATALKVDGSAVTQPISATTLPLPSGAATAALQPTNAAQGSTTSGQTGPLVQGAVASSAPSYSSGTTEPLSMTTTGAVRVDGSATTQPVSGTFWQATQPVSGTFWQATQPVSGTVSVTQAVAANLNATARIVGNAGGALDAAQNAAAPANELVVGGVYNSSAPTLTSGNASQLQLDASGNLNVNIKAGAGSGGTASSFGATFPATGTAAGAEYLSSPPTLTSGQMVALQVTSAGSLHTTIDNASVPVTGTFWQTTQPVSAASLPLPSGAATAANQTNVQGVIGAATAPASMAVGGGVFNTTKPTLTTGQSAAVQMNASGSILVDGSAVTQPISGNVGITGTATISGTVTANQGGAPWTMKPDGTAWALTGTSANVNLTNASVAVTGTFWQATQPISAASLPLPSGASTAANQTNVQGVIGAATAPASMGVIGGVFNTTKPTLTTGQSSAVQLNASGIQLVDGSSVTQPISGNVGITGTATISGTVTANQGGAPWTMKPDGTAWAMTSTSANVNVTNASIPVTGTFWQATQPVSGTFWQATQPVSIAAHVTVDQGTAGAGAWPVSLTSTTITGTVSCTQSGTWTVQPGNTANTTPWLVTARNVGNTGAVLDFAGQNAASPANALLMGGQYNTTPTALTSGNASPLQLDASGNLKVSTPATVTAGGSWTSATPANTTITIPNNPSVLGQLTVTTTITAGAVTFEESYDNGTTWGTVPSARLVNPLTGAQIANPYTFVANTNLPFELISTGTTQIRARLSTAITGTGSVSASITSSPLINEVQVFQTNPANLQAAAQCIQTAANNGLTSSRVNAAASTNATSLKGSGGNIASIDVFNVAAYMVFLKLYNKASAPTVGTDTPVWTIPIVPNGGYSFSDQYGEYFSIGIAYAITKLQADSDTTAVAAGDVTGRIKWI